MPHVGFLLGFPRSRSIFGVQRKLAVVPASDFETPAGLVRRLDHACGAVSAPLRVQRSEG